MVRETLGAHFSAVGISIPPEIYELVRGISIIKAIVFVINVAVFVYLLKSFPKHSASTDS